MSSIYYLMQEIGSEEYHCIFTADTLQECSERRYSLLKTNRTLSLSHLTIWDEEFMQRANMTRGESFFKFICGFGVGIYEDC